MNGKEKGQIFSLDFILSMVLVMLALGLMFQFMEANAYSFKKAELDEELNAVGETAAYLLVTNPAITCDLVDASDLKIGELNNCLARNNNLQITGEKLGLPTSFNYCLTSDGVPGDSIHPSSYTDCTASSLPPSGVKDVFSAKRKIIVYKPNGENKDSFPKSELLDCRINRNCQKIYFRTLTLKVWRS
ncbi:MAG: hypothetical protein V1494_02530 [Candidatus Diapherotrites archaeon]